MALGLDFMTFWLPLVSLFLAVLSWVAFRDRKRPSWKIDLPRSTALIALVLVAALLAARFGPDLDRTGLVVGIVTGGVLSWLASLLGGTATPLALSIAAASALHLLPQTSVPAAQLALLGGVGLGVLTLGGEAPLGASLLAAVGVAGDNLCAAHSKAAGAPFVGSEIGLAIVVGALIIAWDPKRLVPLRPVAVGILALAAALFAGRAIGDTGLPLAGLLGATAGVVLAWLLPDEDSEPVRVGLAAVIGVGVATIAFGFAKGAGMAVALVASAGVLLAVGNSRAVLTLGPLVGLVMYRVLREQGTGATRALDIGQHYTLLTLLLGAILPLLPTDWSRRPGLRGSVGAFLLGVLYIAVPPLVIVLFGMRGGIGFVVGLGLTGLCQSLRQRAEATPLALGAGACGTTILCLSWLSKVDEMTRDEKVRLLAYTGTGILIIAVVLAFIGRAEKQEVPA